MKSSSRTCTLVPVHKYIIYIYFFKLVYTGCGDSHARCFDAKSGALKRTFKGHTGSINCLRVILFAKFYS